MAANPYETVTTDSTNLTDEEDWGLPVRKHKFYGTSRFTGLCNTFHCNRRTVFTCVAVAVVVLMVIIIIIVATSNSNSERHPTGHEDKWKDTVMGLVFYPVPEDKSVVISFTPDDFSKTADHLFVKSLDNVTEGYNLVEQLNEQQFTTCNISYTDYNKTCRVSRVIFGDECTSQSNYGYRGGQPCVYIQLNLPDHVVIKPIKQDSDLWDQAKPFLKNFSPDPSYIPVTCRGTTDVDQEILERPKGYGRNGERITYHPEHGLLSYLYRERNTSLAFLKPAVMVQFTSLMSRHMVHITCTAWGQLYTSNDTLIDHDLLSIQFALYSNHS